MVREDLVEGAVTCKSNRFLALPLPLTRLAVLQDQSVATAPIEQKLSFLRSKNLTQEEIDASLARAGQSNISQPPTQSQAYPPQYRQPPPQQNYGYPPYWNQPPPEPPHRDWRDWFIMATVASGVSYAVYWTAKRYIYPLIAPPTPPQLEQDKAHIDTSFEKTFALLDQLATDTQELKDAEAARKERLDNALGEVESVIGKMKEANENRENEAKRWAREIDEIREQIPLAIQKEKEGVEGRLKDLSVEMKSLKTLVANRMAQPAAPQRSSFSGGGSGVNGMVSGSPQAAMAGGGAEVSSGVNGSAVSEQEDKPAQIQPALPSDRTAAPGPYGSRMLGGKPQIPSWQLAAKKRSEEAAAAKKEEAAVNGNAVQDVQESGTMEDQVGA